MEDLNSPIHIFATIEYKLVLTLHVSYDQLYVPPVELFMPIQYALFICYRSQNVISWDSFLKGFVSISLQTMGLVLDRFVHLFI
jgi:hypothetical protein